MAKRRRRRVKGQTYIFTVLLISLIFISSLLILRSQILEIVPKATYSYIPIVDTVKNSLERVVSASLATYSELLWYSGNGTFSRERAIQYMEDGFDTVFSSLTSYGVEFAYFSDEVIIDARLPRRRIMKGEVFKAYWYHPSSVTAAAIRFNFNLTTIGLYNYAFNVFGQAFYLLKVEIIRSGMGKLRLRVLREGNTPVLGLNEKNFRIWYFDGNKRTWVEGSVRIENVFSDGRYYLRHSILGPKLEDGTVPLLVMVEDVRGIKVVAFSVKGYEYAIQHSQTGTHAIYSVEVFNDGKWYFTGSELSFEGNAEPMPLPPIPGRLLRINTTDGKPIPFQIEDWSSNNLFPLGIANPHNHIDYYNRVCFPLNSSVSGVDIWWVDDMDAEPPSFNTDLHYVEQSPNSKYWNSNYWAQIVRTGSWSGCTLNPFQLKLARTSSSSTFEYIEFARANYKEAAAWGAYTDAIVENAARNMFLVELEYPYRGGCPSPYNIYGIPNAPDTYVLVIVTFPAYAKYITFTVHLILDRVTNKTLSDFRVIYLKTGFKKFAAENGTQIVTKLPSGENYAKFYNGSKSGWGDHNWVVHYHKRKNLGVALMLTEQNLQALYSQSNKGGIVVVKSGNEYIIEMKPVDGSYKPKTSPISYPAVPQTIAVITWSGIFWVYNGDGYTEINNYSFMVENPPVITSVTKYISS